MEKYTTFSGKKINKQTNHVSCSQSPQVKGPAFLLSHTCDFTTIMSSTTAFNPNLLAPNKKRKAHPAAATATKKPRMESHSQDGFQKTSRQRLLDQAFASRPRDYQSWMSGKATAPDTNALFRAKPKTAFVKAKEEQQSSVAASNTSVLFRTMAPAVNNPVVKEESLADALTRTGELSSTGARLACYHANSKQKKLLALSTGLKPKFTRRGKENKPAATSMPFKKPAAAPPKAKKASPPSAPSRPTPARQPDEYGYIYQGYDQFWYKKLDNFDSLFPTGPIKIKDQA